MCNIKTWSVSTYDAYCARLFYRSSAQNDAVSKNAGFLRSHGRDLRPDYLVPVERPQAHSFSERISGGFHVADELPCRAVDLAFLKLASSF